MWAALHRVHDREAGGAPRTLMFLLADCLPRGICLCAVRQAGRIDRGLCCCSDKRKSPHPPQQPHLRGRRRRTHPSHRHKHRTHRMFQIRRSYCPQCRSLVECSCWWVHRSHLQNLTPGCSDEPRRVIRSPQGIWGRRGKGIGDELGDLRS